jgi:outer membrane lipoprotein SlyB
MKMPHKTSYSMNLLRLLLISLMATLVVGCTSSLQGDTYSKEDARKVQRVRYAVVEDMRMVVIEGNQSAVGSIGGAAIGGIAGSSVGGGKGSDIAAIAGAIAGGVLGSKAEEAATRKQGIELVIRLEDTDQIIAVVQEHNPEEIFEKGDRVRLMTVNGKTRVAQ